jgi:hypothetical protein
MSARESLLEEARHCDGSAACGAPVHMHGCFSDNGRNCDHPSEHLRVGLRVDDDGRLARFER